MRLCLNSILLSLVLITFVFAQTLFKWGNEELIVRRMQLRQQAQSNQNKEAADWSGESSPHRSVKKAVLFSLVIPGSGQVYAQSYIKGMVFLAVELTAWALNISYNRKGDNKDTEFRTYADEHWSEYRYWSYVAYRAATDLDEPPFSLEELQQQIFPDGRIWYLIPENQYTPDVVQQLREIESLMHDFSHRLPGTKTQQYYEMIGKYPAQFGYAWDDASFNQRYSGYTGQYTARNKFYMDMRDEANHFYKIAGYGAMTALVNHVIAAIDAGFTARKFNRIHSVKVRMNYKNKLYKGESLNMLGLALHW